MHHILWEYEVRPDQIAEFEAFYGPEGSWARLFRSAKGYGGTDLFRDVARPTRFLTVDRWASPEAFDACLRDHREAYDRLDAEASAFTVAERRIGAFQA